MTATCSGCGVEFEAASKRAKWCSEKCRKRGPRAEGVEIAPLPRGLVEAMERDLEVMGVLDSVPGQQLMTLAARMVSPLETASSAAAASREVSRLFDALKVSSKPVVSDPVDEMAARRDGKARKAAG